MGHVTNVGFNINTRQQNIHRIIVTLYSLRASSKFIFGILKIPRMQNRQNFVENYRKLWMV